MSSEPGVGASASALAAEAYALVQARPRRALALARRPGDRRADRARRARGGRRLHALGWAQNVLGDRKAAVTDLPGGNPRRRARRRRPRLGAAPPAAGVPLALGGKVGAARREIDAALALLSGRDRARSRFTVWRSIAAPMPSIHETHRRPRADIARALRVLRRHGDRSGRRGSSSTAACSSRSRRARRRRARPPSRADALRGARRRHWRTRRARAVAEVTRLRGDVIGCLAIVDEVRAALPQAR